MSKKQYISPSVVRSVAVETGAEILAGSVVNQSNLEAAPQQVDELDFSSSSGTFSHNWEGGDGV